MRPHERRSVAIVQTVNVVLGRRARSAQAARSVIDWTGEAQARVEGLESTSGRERLGYGADRDGKGVWGGGFAGAQSLLRKRRDVSTVSLHFSPVLRLIIFTDRDRRTSCRFSRLALLSQGRVQHISRRFERPQPARRPSTNYSRT